MPTMALRRIKNCMSLPQAEALESRMLSNQVELLWKEAKSSGAIESILYKEGSPIEIFVFAKSEQSEKRLTSQF